MNSRLQLKEDEGNKNDDAISSGKMREEQQIVAIRELKQKGEENTAIITGLNAELKTKATELDNNRRATNDLEQKFDQFFGRGIGTENRRGAE